MQFFFDFFGAPDVVQHMNHCFSGRFDDICRQTDAVETTTIIVGNDIHLTQRIFTVPFGGQAVFHQFDVVLSYTVDCLINGIDRTVTVRRFGFDFFTTGQLDGGGGDVV